MSFLNKLDNRPYRSRPISWDAERSTDRFAYRIRAVGPDSRAFRNWLLLLTAIGVGVLAFLVYNKLAPLNPAVPELADSSEVAVLSNQPAPVTTIIQPVSEAESWAVISSLEAQVYVLPTIFSPPIQKLSRFTLVAFEKKSSDGWYMLLGGGGWVQATQVKTYSNESAANNAITQGRNQASTYRGYTTELPPTK